MSREGDKLEVNTQGQSVEPGDPGDKEDHGTIDLERNFTARLGPGAQRERVCGMNAGNSMQVNRAGGQGHRTVLCWQRPRLMGSGVRTERRSGGGEDRNPGSWKLQ